MGKKSSFPKIKGKIDIFPEIHYGNQISICIIGTKKGLKSFADTINHLAEIDPDDEDIPAGARYHIHLSSSLYGGCLGKYSVNVEICQAEAKGTKELPDFMDES